jgi:hypothetical protein
MHTSLFLAACEGSQLGVGGNSEQVAQVGSACDLQAQDVLPYLEDGRRRRPPRNGVADGCHFGGAPIYYAYSSSIRHYWEILKSCRLIERLRPARGAASRSLAKRVVSGKG